MHLKKHINLVLLAFCFFFVCVGGYSIYRISAIQAGYAAARKEYIEIQEEYKTEKPAWDFTVIEEGISILSARRKNSSCSRVFIISLPIPLP